MLDAQFEAFATLGGMTSVSSHYFAFGRDQPSPRLRLGRQARPSSPLKMSIGVAIPKSLTSESVVQYR
jgi:hypothetical protein